MYRPFPFALLFAATPTSSHQETALNNVEEVRQHGGLISEQRARSRGGSEPRHMTYPDGNSKAGGGGLLPTSSRAGPIAEFRNRSSSAWLHFPHFELLFLFFAFEGVVTAAAKILQYPGCPYAFYPALAALVSSIQREGILLHTAPTCTYKKPVVLKIKRNDWRGDTYCLIRAQLKLLMIDREYCTLNPTACSSLGPFPYRNAFFLSSMPQGALPDSHDHGGVAYCQASGAS